MILKEGQPIGQWHVVYLIKENPYAESYRVEDEGGNPYFLKIYRLKNTPDKLIHDGEITEIAVSRQLSHKNIVSYIDDGIYNDESGECRYLVATYFSGELLSEMLQHKKKNHTTIITTTDIRTIREIITITEKVLECASLMAAILIHLLVQKW